MLEKTSNKQLTIIIGFILIIIFLIGAFFANKTPKVEEKTILEEVEEIENIEKLGVEEEIMSEKVETVEKVEEKVETTTSTTTPELTKEEKEFAIKYYNEGKHYVLKYVIDNAINCETVSMTINEEKKVHVVNIDCYNNLLGQYNSIIEQINKQTKE